MNQSSVTAGPAPVTPKARRTREALFRAAERVFGENGYERASIADITRLAGVAHGTFYLHFRDKRSVYLALVDKLGDELRRAIAAATEQLRDRLEIEREGFRAFFRFTAEHRDLYRIVRQAEFVDEPTYRAYYDRLASAYARGLRRAMDRGEIRQMAPERLAWALMGIGDFLGMRWVLWEEEPDIDGLTEDAMDLIRGGMDPEKRGPPGREDRTRIVAPRALKGAK